MTMQATIQKTSTTGNDIQAELQKRLGNHIDVWSLEDPARPGVVEDALLSDEGSAIVHDESGRSEVAIELPDHTVAVWTTKRALGYASLRHARTVMELLQASNTRDQLQAETDALATQVVNDFEELSLIRSLASAMELPSSGVDLQGLCERTLVPLAEGIGAVSIAAVFLDDDGEGKSVWWSGDAQTDNESLLQLIEEHCQEVGVQPVVRNRNNEFDHVIEAEEVSEFILVQCCSEGRLHGWLVACNRTDDALEEVP